MPTELLAEVVRQSSRPTPEELESLVQELRRRFGDALEAVLHYGSCLHNSDPFDGIVDLIAVVRDYESAYDGPILRTFNAVLPPNSFYFEVGEGRRRLRAKYGVFSCDHFDAGTYRWLRPYVWARLAQPSRVLWTSDVAAEQRLHEGLARAVLRFHTEVLPLLAGEELDVGTLWRRGLVETYRSELRPEGRDRAAWLVEHNGDDYARLTAAAVPAFPGRLEPLGDGRYRVSGSEAHRRRSKRRWFGRRWYSKVISTLVLGKSALTFAKAADYVAHKIERHTGTSIRVTPFMRRHPFICAPYALVSYLWRGIIR